MESEEAVEKSSAVNVHVHLVGWCGSSPLPGRDVAEASHAMKQETQEILLGAGSEAQELMFAHLLLRCPLLEEAKVCLSASCVEPSEATIATGRADSSTVPSTEKNDAYVLQVAASVLRGEERMRSDDGTSSENPSKVLVPLFRPESKGDPFDAFQPYSYFHTPFEAIESALWQKCFQKELEKHSNPRAGGKCKGAKDLRSEGASTSDSPLPYFDVIVASDRDSFEYIKQYYHFHASDSPTFTRSSAGAHSMEEVSDDLDSAAVPSGKMKSPKVGVKRAHRDTEETSEGASVRWTDREGGKLKSSSRDPVLLLYASSRRHSSTTTREISNIASADGPHSLYFAASSGQGSTGDATSTSSRGGALSSRLPNEQDGVVCAYAVQQLLESLFIISSQPKNTGGKVYFNANWREKVEEAVSLIGPLLSVDFMVLFV